MVTKKRSETTDSAKGFSRRQFRKWPAPGRPPLAPLVALPPSAGNRYSHPTAPTPQPTPRISGGSSLPFPRSHPQRTS